MTLTVDILINNIFWVKYDKKIESYIENLVEKTLSNTDFFKSLSENHEVEVSIVLTHDKEIQNLNKIYRDKNEPTNILSFPVLSPEDIKNGNFLLDNFIAIGDIILSFEMVESQAKEQNKTFHNHLAHLIIHGVLHLIGYDHKSEDEAKIMEDLEIKLLKELEIPNPYML